MRPPKISICIPAYENPGGIRRLLESILVQLYTDYEVIITDDSESDAVKDAVEEIMSGFIAYGTMGYDHSSQIRYFRNAVRKGAVANWNEAISKARGSYIKIMHHDDWFTDEYCLQQFSDLLDRNPGADLAFCGTFQVEEGMSDDEAEKTFGKKGPFKKPRTEAEKRHREKSKTARGISDSDLSLIQSDWRNLYLGNTIGAPSAVMVRKSAIDRYHISYDENLTWLVDEEYYMQILSRNPKMAASTRPLVSIGLSFGQLTEKVENDPELLKREYTYIYRKYHLQDADPAYKQRLSDVLAANGTKKKELAPDLEIPGNMFRESLAAVKKKNAERYLSTFDYLIDKAEDTMQKKAGKIPLVLFYVGLLMELVIVIIDKSALTNPYEGQLFRVTFVLFFIKLLFTKLDRRERGSLLVFLILGFISWRVSGRNEILRITVFIYSMRDLDIRKVMKTALYVTGAGCLFLSVLSFFGAGVLKLTQDFGHGAVETRYCFGMGHPNAAHCMALMILSLFLYLEHDRLKKWQYALLFALNALLFCYTKSDTAFILGSLEIVLFFAARYQKMREGSIWYILCEALLAAGIAVSLLGAVINPQDHPRFQVLDSILTGRVNSLWDTTFHEGTLSTWHLFGDRRNTTFFDLGFVRIVYWYGTIPAAAAGILLARFFRAVRKRRDAAAFIFLFILCAYTVLEAHLVSEYLGRNFLFLLAAGYMPLLLGEENHKGNTDR